MDPHGSTERSPRKGVTAGGLVDDLNPFSESAENYGMFSDNVSGPHGLNAYFFCLPLTDDPFSGVYCDIVKVSV
jgi:hypothetical protein